MIWKPPRSPHNLIQEDLWPDAWRMLIACLMLNLTTRKQVDGVIYEFFKMCPTAELCASKDPAELESLLRPLGMQFKRSKTLVRFSQEYLKGWNDIGDLHGVGKYARDSHLIFSEGRYTDVVPHDHALVDYWKWLNANHSH